MLGEAGEAGWVAAVSCFHAIEIGLPGGAADGGEATRADGISGSVLIHAVRKLENNEMMWGHSTGTSGALAGT
jgi:hypothetical protein